MPQVLFCMGIMTLGKMTVGIMTLNKKKDFCLVLFWRFSLSMMTLSILTFKKCVFGLVLYRHHDTWQNDPWHNDTWHNDTWHNDPWHNDTWHNDTWHNDNEQKIFLSCFVLAL
jgi:hypothetical protein